MVGDNNNKKQNKSVLGAPLALSSSWTELQAGAKVDQKQNQWTELQVAAKVE